MKLGIMVLKWKFLIKPDTLLVIGQMKKMLELLIVKMGLRKYVILVI